jgi:hypothetical protein
MASSSRCPVCAGEIHEEHVDCTTCGALYHRDCFTYNAKCAIYGCSGQNCTTGPSTELPTAVPLVVEAEVPPPVPAGPVEIESTGFFRTVGLSLITTGNSSFFSSADETPGGTPGGMHLPDMDPAGFLLLVVLAPILLLLWFLVVRGLIPLGFCLTGHVIKSLRSHSWRYDETHEQLVCTTELLGFPVGEACWRRTAIKLVTLDVYRSRRLYLVAHLHDGKSLWLADDRHDATTGYNCEALAELGQRLGAALDVPFDDCVHTAPAKLPAAHPAAV